MIMKRKMMKVAVTLLVFTIALCLASACSSGGASGSKQTVRILSANYEEQIAIQLEYLKGIYPDADIEITYMPSGNLAAKIQAEGQDTDYDIALSLSSAYANTLKNQGLLRKFQPENAYKDEYADPDGMVSPNGVWCGAMLINTIEIDKLGLPEPKSYMDLLDPVYKGHIVMSNPNSSSTGYFFLLGLLNLYGEEAGWDYFDKLSENILIFGESGSVPSSKVMSGEAVIGLGIDYEGMRLAGEGKPVKVVFAEEGAPFDFDTALLINRKAEPTDFVLKVMNTITSIEGNAVFNNYNISVLKDGADRGDYPADFKVLDMRGITDADLKAAISAKWSERHD